MRKRYLAPALMALAILGAVIAVKSFTVPTSSTSIGQTAVAATHVPIMDNPIATMKIVPAPVIDPDAEYFIGTGDGSAGVWVRPDHHTP